jgi:hypothetical protein
VPYQSLQYPLPGGPRVRRGDKNAMSLDSLCRGTLTVIIL